MTDIEDSAGYPNLANILNALDPNGNEAKLANILSKKKPMLMDIPWVEGNLPTGHQISQAANAATSGTWRRMNEGVPATKAETAAYVESCGRLEDLSKVDEALAELNGGAAYRNQQDKLKEEYLAQQFATAAWYESVSSNPERIHGLTARFPGTSGFTTSSYTFAGTNAGVNAQSIWLATWEPGRLYGVYPKGTKAGLEKNDKGKQHVTDSSGNSFFAWMTQYVWRCGIAVEDYRYIVRFQWDPDDADMGTSEKGMYLKMQDMLTQIYDKSPNTRFYMSRTSMMRLAAQLSSNDANFLTYLAKGGDILPHFMGIPIRIEDALVAETAIT